MISLYLVFLLQSRICVYLCVCEIHRGLDMDMQQGGALEEPWPTEM